MSATEVRAATGSARRKIRAGRLMVILFLLAVVGVVGFFLLLERRNAALLAENLAALKAAGEPVTPADFESYYALPFGRQDCTQLYLAAGTVFEGKDFEAAAANLPIVGGGDFPVPLPGQPWPELAQVEQFLSGYQPQLEMLHEAARRGGGARYPINFNAGMTTLLDHVARLRTSARMLELESFARAHRGDAHGAAKSIRAIWRAGESLEFEPIMISQMVRVAIGSVAVSQVRVLLPSVEFADEDLRMLQVEFRTFRARDSLVRSMFGERMWGLHAFENYTVKELTGTSPTLPVLFTTSDKLFYLEHMNRLVDAANLPPPRSRTEIKLASDDVERQLAGGPLKRIGKTLSTILFPGVMGAVDVAYRAEARLGATDAGLAAELFRRQHRRWPATLDELVPDFLPAVPLDPFDGQPLRMAAQGEGLVIYSVGPDCTDDHGQDEEFTGRPDVSFPVTLPATAKQ